MEIGIILLVFAGIIGNIMDKFPKLIYIIFGFSGGALLVYWIKIAIYNNKMLDIIPSIIYAFVGIFIAIQSLATKNSVSIARESAYKMNAAKIYIYPIHRDYLMVCNLSDFPVWVWIYVEFRDKDGKVNSISDNELLNWEKGWYSPPRKKFPHELNLDSSIHYLHIKYYFSFTSEKPLKPFVSELDYHFDDSQREWLVTGLGIHDYQYFNIDKSDTEILN